MSKTRFTPWVVLACIGTLAGCTSGEGDSAGNTQLNVIVPTGGGSSAPGPIDIQIVEYTIACDADPLTATGLGVDSIEPSYNPDVTINGVLEVLDTASGPSNGADFGVDLDEVYVWQGFMDIPLDATCTVQLRARDNDGEVICTDTVDFNTNVNPGDPVKVNVLMYCGISFQAPVAMLDLDADFSFNISNFCPDLYVLNCIDSEIDFRTLPNPFSPGTFITVAPTACQVRFRDGDNQCGDSCDPQSCVADAEGLTCTAPQGTCEGGDNPGAYCNTPASPSLECQGTSPLADGNCVARVVETTITCSGGAAAIDCDGIPNELLGQAPDTECTFTGDTFGQIGGAAPGAGAPGEGGFFVACAVIPGSDPPQAVTPGAVITCEAVTTDGDEDCNKVKTVQVTCPGNTPCQDFGGNAACQAASTTVCQVGTCNNATCDGADPTACCDYTDAADDIMCPGEGVPSPAVCKSGVCTSLDCNAQADPDASCSDGNECTTNTCDAPPATTCSTVNNTNTCNGNTGVCAGGSCVSNCDGVSCDDGNPCTDDATCDPSGGVGTCGPSTPNDTNACAQGDGTEPWDTCTAGTACVCNAGVCEDAPPPAAQLAQASGITSSNFSCTISGNVTVNLTVDADLSVDSSGVNDAVDLAFNVLALEPGTPLLAGVAGATSIQLNIPGFSPADTAAVTNVTNGTVQGPLGPSEIANELNANIPLGNLFNVLTARQPLCAALGQPFCPFNDIILNTPPLAAIPNVCNGTFSSQCVDLAASEDGNPVFQTPAKDCDVFQGSGTGLPLACDAGFSCLSGYCNTNSAPGLVKQICELNSECKDTCVASECANEPGRTCTVNADCNQVGTCTSFPPDPANPAIPRTNCNPGNVPGGWVLAQDNVAPDAVGTAVLFAQDRIDLNIAALFGVLPIFVSTGDPTICTINSQDPPVAIPAIAVP